MSIQLWIQLGSGWVTYDDVSLRPVVTYNLSYDAENRLSGVSGATKATSGGETLYHLLGDHLGSSAITVDASGNKAAELRYKVWGGNRCTAGK